MLEKTVEAYLVERVRALGGTAYKFTSPARASVPDRIVVLPPGRIFFVEVKRPGGKLTRGQEREHEHLRRLGADVRVLGSIGAINAFLNEVQAVAADGASAQHCNLGVGCDEAGVCYASAHGDASQCGRAAVSPAAADRICTLIPLSERHPIADDHPRVIVFTDGSDFNGAQFFDVSADTLNECFYESPDEQPEVCRHATHWMPRPSLRHAAPATADERAALQWTAGTLQEIVSGRWKGAKESDKVSIGSVTKTVAQVLDMADAALGRASQAAAPASPDWRHIANEWADVATNGIQAVKNVRDGIDSADEAIARLKADIERCRALPTQAAAPADAREPIYQSRLLKAPAWTDVSRTEFEACAAKPDQFEARTLCHVPADAGEAVAKPRDCSGTPESCPDNEGYGCHCSDAARAQGAQGGKGGGA